MPEYGSQSVTVGTATISDTNDILLSSERNDAETDILIIQWKMLMFLLLIAVIAILHSCFRELYIYFQNKFQRRFLIDSLAVRPRKRLGMLSTVLEQEA